MIRFQQGTWHSVFYWWGGINRLLIVPAGAYLILATVLYYVELSFVQHLPNTTTKFMHSFGGFVAFLLVFRLNQCMARYKLAQQGTAVVFASLKGIISSACLNLKGSAKMTMPANGQWSMQEVELAKQYSELALVTKLNCIRLALAASVAWLLHSRLLGAANDAEGGLDEEGAEELRLLHERLQGLLYPEEMAVLNGALCVTRQAPGRYRAEVCRHIHRPVSGEPVLGSCELASVPLRGTTFAPLPGLVLMMLERSLLPALDEPWGYPQRMLNIFLGFLNDIRRETTQLSHIIADALPLSYVQHCHFLVVTFAVCYPLSVDPAVGFVGNVLMPTALFWAMLGIEILSSLLENPLGDDVTDLDILAMVHGLEVHAQSCFELTEEHDLQLQHAMWRPLRDFHMSTARAKQGAPDLHEGAPVRLFGTYFRWLEIPALQLESIMGCHGQADTIHQAQLNLCLASLSMRTWLAFRHAWAGPGGQYHPVGQLPECAEDRSQAGQAPWVREAQRDPMFFTHYLVFTPAHARRRPRRQRHQAAACRSSLRAPLLEPVPGGCAEPPAATAREQELQPPRQRADHGQEDGAS